MTQQRDILANRRDKLKRWRATGLAYSNQFRRDAEAQALHDAYRDADKAALEADPVQTAVAGGSCCDVLWVRQASSRCRM